MKLIHEQATFLGVGWIKCQYAIWQLNDNRYVQLTRFTGERDVELVISRGVNRVTSKKGWTPWASQSELMQWIPIRRGEPWKAIIGRIDAYLMEILL